MWGSDAPSRAARRGPWRQWVSPSNPDILRPASTKGRPVRMCLPSRIAISTRILETSAAKAPLCGASQMTPGRRSIRYENLDGIMPDVEHLLRGYTKVGQWSVGGMCRHLASIMRASVDLPASTKFDPSMRVDADTRRAMLERGEIPEGIPTGPALEPPTGLDDREEAENLRAAIVHYRSSADPEIDHPLLGPLTRPEWDRMHCHHAAHHFSFAIPTDGGR